MLCLFGCSQFQISALSTLVVGKRPTNIQRLCGWQCVCACFVLCHACFTMFTMQNGKGNATSVAWERMQTWNNNVIGCRHMPNSAHTHIHTHTWERQRQVVLRGVGAFLVGFRVAWGKAYTHTWVTNVWVHASFVVSCLAISYTVHSMRCAACVVWESMQAWERQRLLSCVHVGVCLFCMFHVLPCPTQFVMQWLVAKE